MSNDISSLFDESVNDDLLSLPTPPPTTPPPTGFTSNPFVRGRVISPPVTAGRVSLEAFAPEIDLIHRNPTNSASPPPGPPPRYSGPPPIPTARPRLQPPVPIPTATPPPAAPTPRASLVITPVSPTTDRLSRPGVVASFGFGGRFITSDGSQIRIHRISLPDHLQDHLGVFPLGAVNEFTTNRISDFCKSQSHNSILHEFFFASNKQAFVHACLLHEFRDGSNLIPIIIELNKNNLKLILNPKFFNFSNFLISICSIHSPEFFRESILFFTSLLEPPKDASTLSGESPTIIRAVQNLIRVYASTTMIEISDEIVKNWKLYLGLVVSFLKPSSPVSVNQFLFRLSTALTEAGDVKAGHLTLLLSNRKPGLDPVDFPESQISILGVDHKKNFNNLIEINSLILSEIFEYKSRQSSPDTLFIPLQPFKYVTACLLAGDYGETELAERYCQMIQLFLKSVPSNRYSVFFRQNLRELEQRLQGPQQTSQIVGGALKGIWGGIQKIAITSKLIPK
jgi:hypothetical protein